jgi:hypothetical protein
MTEIAVICDECGTKSRVPAFAAGKMAICPGCRNEFVIRLAAEPEPAIPTVYPPASKEDNAVGLLVGLAISAFLVPLAWLLAKTLGAGPPVFTYGLPLSIAFAAAGLGIGVALARDWSTATRVKAIITLLLLAWGLSVFFFTMKPEWVEKWRKELNIFAGQWQEFSPPSRNYRVKMPGTPKAEPVLVVDGWQLIMYRLADRDKGTYAFCVGEGQPAAAAVGRTDDQFFADAKAGAEAASKGTLQSEQDLTLDGYPGREYRIKMADNATNRTLRIYRVETKVVVAMAEGAFLPPDAREVQRFFSSLQLTPGR